MYAIHASGLTKTYPPRKQKENGSIKVPSFRPQRETFAVDNVSFDIAEGEIVGYIGLNGAGKSTTVKMLTGILTPTRGKASVYGVIPYKERKRNAFQIGVVFGQRSQLWWDLPLCESFFLLRDIYGLENASFRHNLERFSEILGLSDLLDVPVRQLSLGQRMRAEIASAFLHNPRVVFLDEPTIGLDILIKDQLLTFIRELNASNRTTVFLTTHNLNDIEQICNRIMLIHEGRLIFNGTLEHILDRFGRQRSLRVELAREYPDIVLEGAVLVERGVQEVVFSFDRARHNTAEMIARLVNRYETLDVSIKDPTLEMVVKSLLVDQKR